MGPLYVTVKADGDYKVRPIQATINLQGLRTLVLFEEHYPEHKNKDGSVFREAQTHYGIKLSYKHCNYHSYIWLKEEDRAVVYHLIMAALAKYQYDSPKQALPEKKPYKPQESEEGIYR